MASSGKAEVIPVSPVVAGQEKKEKKKKKKVPKKPAEEEVEEPPKDITNIEYIVIVRKRVRNLRKKLSDIDALEQKQLVVLTDAQVANKTGILRQIDDLEKMAAQFEEIAKRDSMQKTAQEAVTLLISLLSTLNTLDSSAEAKHAVLSRLPSSVKVSGEVNLGRLSQLASKISGVDQSSAQDTLRHALDFVNGVPEEFVPGATYKSLGTHLRHVVTALATIQPAQPPPSENGHSPSPAVQQQPPAPIKQEAATVASNTPKEPPQLTAASPSAPVVPQPAATISAVQRPAAPQQPASPKPPATPQQPVVAAQHVAAPQQPAVATLPPVTSQQPAPKQQGSPQLPVVQQNEKVPGVQQEAPPQSGQTEGQGEGQRRGGYRPRGGRRGGSYRGRGGYHNAEVTVDGAAEQQAQPQPQSPNQNYGGRGGYYRGGGRGGNRGSYVPRGDGGGGEGSYDRSNRGGGSRRGGDRPYRGRGGDGTGGAYVPRGGRGGGHAQQQEGSPRVPAPAQVPAAQVPAAQVPAAQVPAAQAPAAQAPPRPNGA